MSISTYRELRPAYGFDEVAIVPGSVTVNPELIDVRLVLGQHTFEIPIVAAALDSVSDPRFAVEVGKRGGLAVMNLEGIQFRYEDPQAAVAEIIAASLEDSAGVIQRLYAAPIREELIGRRIRAVKEGGAICAVSCTPANTKKLAPIAVDAGADIIVVQSTVTTARHISRSPRGLIIEELVENIRVPEVVGVGVPQVTATMDCAAARDQYYRESGRYVPVITDGGMRNGGDVCKAL